MTTLTTALLAFAIILAVTLVRVARINLMQAALIRALQHSVRLAKDEARIQRGRADWLADRNGELEDRNAFLERARRNGALAYVLDLPEADAPTVLEQKSGTINLN